MQKKTPPSSYSQLFQQLGFIIALGFVGLSFSSLFLPTDLWALRRPRSRILEEVTARFKNVPADSYQRQYLSKAILNSCFTFFPETNLVKSCKIPTDEPKAKFYWVRVESKNQTERSRIANMGANVASISDHSVVVGGHLDLLAELQAEGFKFHALEVEKPRLFETSGHLPHAIDYEGLIHELKVLEIENPSVAKLDTLGSSSEFREVWDLHITDAIDDANSMKKKPGLLFIGQHQGGDYLSVEVLVQFAKYLLEAYKAKNADIVRLIRNRDIHIVPMFNPDAYEFNVKQNPHISWNKNRQIIAGQGEIGAALSFNYPTSWGMGGSSMLAADDTFMGEYPFDQFETQDLQSFLKLHPHIKALVNLTQGREKVLYPWGHTYEPIANAADLKIFQTIANKISSLNGYPAEQMSSQYIYSGNIIDWAYAEHRVFSFTLQIEPFSLVDGLFENILPMNKLKHNSYSPINPNWLKQVEKMDLSDLPRNILQKNKKAFLYLLELADVPSQRNTSSTSTSK